MPAILLINPKVRKDRTPQPKRYAAREPLSILTLGSYIKKAGIEIKLLDAVLYEEGYIRDLIFNLITNEARPILIGCSVMTAQVSHALELCDFIKSLDQSIPIVWGGPHPTLFPRETSEDSSVDIVVHGRGELPLLKICKQLITEKRLTNDIPGTCIKGKFNKSEESLKMTEYPYLDYELLDLKRYLGPLRRLILSEGKPNRVLQVISSRGCPWRCGYCINKVTSNQWTALNAERYLDELCANIKKFKLDAYRIIDEDFFTSKKRVFEIVEGLIKRGITKRWGANIRANYFRDDYISVTFAKKLKSTGCEFLCLGAESGSQRVLNLITKDITVEQIIDSAKVCNEAEITPIYSWMIGIPTQTKEEIFDTINVMLEVSRICPSAIHYSFWVFRPFPGGDLYDLCIKEGLHAPKTLRGWVEIGVDENANTGYFNVYNLPWIENPTFIDFLSKYAHKIPDTMSKSARRRIEGILAYQTILSWDNMPIRIVLTIIIKMGMYFRKIMSILKYNFQL